MSLSQTPKSHSSKFHKKRLSQDQVRLLEASFDAGKKLEPERKFQLARELGVPPRQIAIWYQNKRARWKNQSLEVDYGALQLRLESALAEKKQLEREVDSLRLELKRAQDMLFGSLREGQLSQAAACATAPPVSSLSSCCDEGAGSSSLNEDVGCSAHWGQTTAATATATATTTAAAASGTAAETLQFEELYACLMLGAAKGSNCGAIAEGVNYERDFWV